MFVEVTSVDRGPLLGHFGMDHLALGVITLALYTLSSPKARKDPVPNSSSFSNDDSSSGAHLFQTHTLYLCTYCIPIHDEAVTIYTEASSFPRCHVQLPPPRSSAISS